MLTLLRSVVMFLVEFLELFVSVNLNDLENCVVLLTLLIIFFRTWASACLTRCTWCEALLASSLLTLDCVIEGTLVVVLPYDYSVGNYTVKILYHSWQWPNIFESSSVKRFCSSFFLSHVLKSSMIDPHIFTSAWCILGNYLSNRATAITVLNFNGLLCLPFSYRHWLE